MPPSAEKKHEAKSLKPETPEPGALVVEESLEIAAPPEKVWKVFTDEQNWPRWNPLVKNARHISGKQWTLGWQFEFVLKPPLLPSWKVHCVVLEVNVPSMVCWCGTAPGLCGNHWFLFEKNETGTRATSYEELTGIGKLFLRLFRGQTSQVTRRWLEALKEECEKGLSTVDCRAPESKP